jgi:hypothetical protein
MLGQRIGTVGVASRGGEVMDVVDLVVVQVVGLAYDGRHPHDRHRIATGRIQAGRLGPLGFDRER